MVASKAAPKPKPKAGNRAGPKKSTAAPWEQGNPNAKDDHHPLSPQAKAAAKRAAKKAGRPYPNLVDNMNAATKARKKAATKPETASPKDPNGGLTAAGRKKAARDEGSQLKPGVKKPMDEMTPEEMKRKGSWATRFYGRAKLPPLKKSNGEPTRFALSAHAWGEAVPATEAQARKIAAKGRKLLDLYRKTKQN